MGGVEDDALSRLSVSLWISCMCGLRSLLSLAGSLRVSLLSVCVCGIWRILSPESLTLALSLALSRS